MEQKWQWSGNDMWLVSVYLNLWKRMAFLLAYFEVVSLKNHLAAGNSFRKSEPRQKTKCPVERLGKRQSDQIEELEHTQANVSADANDNPLITRVASLCSLLHPFLSQLKNTVIVLITQIGASPIWASF